MDEENGHLIEDADGVSVAVFDRDVDGAGVTSKTTAASREAAAAHGLNPRLMDELAELAAGKVRDGGLRLMGEGGLLVELARHLMQAGWRRRWICTWPRRPAAPAAGARGRGATPATATGPARRRSAV
ncbi:hypothetical protein ABT272_28640 [Streptomyces sp900105245]|uniref:Uncharacterized protein n=1 Tax=Streptomyces sp. 900105245 TaxID=3154379 RepID=A0ABV1UD72_9ACTN